MNELTQEKLNTLVTDQVREMFDQYKFITEQMETFKFQARKVMEENYVSKWETDLFSITLTADTMTTKVNTDLLKKSNIFVTNAETGELEEVEAYRFFTHQVPQKGSFRMKVKEEKYGG